MVGLKEHIKICDACGGRKGLSGRVRVWKQFPDGEKEEIKVGNLVVDEGHTLMTDLLGYANSNDKITKLEVGKGTTSPDASDTGVETPLGTPVTLTTTGFTQPTVHSITFSFLLGTSQGNSETITEAALHNDAKDYCLARVTHSGIAKDVSFEIGYEWTITFST